MNYIVFFHFYSLNTDISETIRDFELKFGLNLCVFSLHTFLHCYEVNTRTYIKIPRRASLRLDLKDTCLKLDRFICDID